MKAQYILPAILLLGACGKHKEPAASIAPQYKMSADANIAAKESMAGLYDDVSAENKAVADAAASGAGNASSPIPASIPQKLIQRATIAFSVTDYAKAKAAIRLAVAANKGLVAAENESKDDYSARNILEIRVPADRFEATLNAISGEAKQLDGKQITAEDVTKQYVDTEARMKARKAVEQRYIDILQKANKVDDILAVEEKLNEIREEVEAAQASLQYMDSQVAMSTISLTFYQTFSNTHQQAPGFFSRLGISLADGWNSVLSFTLGLASAWPVLLLIIGALLLLRMLRRKFRRRVSQPQAS